MIRLAVITLSVAVLFAGCSKTEDAPTPREEAGKGSNSNASAKEFSIMVMGMGSKPIEFSGYCVYVANGQERRNELNGTGSLTKAFKAEAVKSCEVRKTSQGGKIWLKIASDGEAIFESPRSESNDPITYQANND